MEPVRVEAQRTVGSHIAGYRPQVESRGGAKHPSSDFPFGPATAVPQAVAVMSRVAGIDRLLPLAPH